MQNQFIIDVLSGVDGLIFPGVVALLTTISGYYATKKIKNDEVENKKEERAQVFIETLDVELSTFVKRLDELSKDPQIFSYFSIKKINKIISCKYSLNSKVDRDIISLPDSKLRKQVRDVISEAFSTIEDISSLENYPLNKAQSYQRVEKETFQEYREIRLKLLLDGICLDENGKAQFLDKKKKDKDKLKHVNQIILDLPSEWRREKQNREFTEKHTNSRRSFLVSQLVISINNINRLIDNLNKSKSK